MPINFELEEEVGAHEGTPKSRVERVRHESGRGADGKEHANDPRGEEEVNTNRVEVLPFDSFKVEDALENVSQWNRAKGSHGQEPNGDVDEWRNVEELRGGARC